MTGNPFPILCALLVLFAGNAFATDTQRGALFPNDPGAYEQSGSAAYSKSIARAVQLRAKGDLVGALAAFSDASGRGDIGEYPNYELWADISDLYCKLGKKKEALALLDEFSCAVEVMSNKKQCWIDKEGPPNSFDVPNPQVLPLCYAAVCNRAYEPLYWQWRGNAHLIEKTKRQMAQISRVRAECR